LVVGRADALPTGVRSLETQALVRLGDLVGIERSGLLDRRLPEVHGVIGAGGDVGVHAQRVLNLSLKAFMFGSGSWGRSE